MARMPRPAFPLACYHVINRSKYRAAVTRRAAFRRRRSLTSNGPPCLTSRPSSTQVALMRTELVTTLKRRATEIIAGLRDEKNPILITQHGKPAAYLVDVASFEELNRRLSVLEGIALGEQAVREGRIVSQTHARRRFSKWLK